VDGEIHDADAGDDGLLVVTADVPVKNIYIVPIYIHGSISRLMGKERSHGPARRGSTGPGPISSLGQAERNDQGVGFDWERGDFRHHRRYPLACTKAPSAPFPRTAAEGGHRGGMEYGPLPSSLSSAVCIRAGQLLL
jgi:hypothetical protein